MDLPESNIKHAEMKGLQQDGALPSANVLARSEGGTDPLTVLGEIITLVQCGFLVSPFEFLSLILDFYGLHLLHLNPNFIAFLSIFTHLCEAYLGVQPFLDLFRYFYEVRWMEASKISGCCGLHLWDGMRDEYIPFNCPSSRRDWRKGWFFLYVEDNFPNLAVPNQKPTRLEILTSKPLMTPALANFVEKIHNLRERDLAGYEVVQDFVRRRIQPLQARSHPAYLYSG